MEIKQDTLKWLLPMMVVVIIILIVMTIKNAVQCSYCKNVHKELEENSKKQLAVLENAGNQATEFLNEVRNDIQASKEKADIKKQSNKNKPKKANVKAAENGK